MLSPEKELRLQNKLDVYHELSTPTACFNCGSIESEDLQDECVDLCEDSMVNPLYWQQSFA